MRGAQFSEGLTPQEALTIDTKVDDGMPWTGGVQAASGGNYIDSTALSGTTGISAPNQCVVSATLTSTYSSPATNYNTRCNLLFKFND